MDKETNYNIHFGKQKFKVNEWLYNYLNEAKLNSKKYDTLYKIITGLKKKPIKINI